MTSTQICILSGFLVRVDIIFVFCNLMVPRCRKANFWLGLTLFLYFVLIVLYAKKRLTPRSSNSVHGFKSYASLNFSWPSSSEVNRSAQLSSAIMNQAPGSCQVLCLQVFKCSNPMWMWVTVAKPQGSKFAQRRGHFRVKYERILLVRT